MHTFLIPPIHNKWNSILNKAPTEAILDNKFNNNLKTNMLILRSGIDNCLWRFQNRGI